MTAEQYALILFFYVLVGTLIGAADIAVKGQKTNVGRLEPLGFELLVLAGGLLAMGYAFAGLSLLRVSWWAWIPMLFAGFGGRWFGVELASSMHGSSASKWLLAGAILAIPLSFHFLL